MAEILSNVLIEGNRTLFTRHSIPLNVGVRRGHFDPTHILIPHFFLRSDHFPINFRGNMCMHTSPDLTGGRQRRRFSKENLSLTGKRAAVPSL